MKKTREMRRAEKTYHAKKAATTSWKDPFEDDVESYKQLLLSKGIDPKHIMHFYKNGVITVTVFDFPEVEILSYRLNTEGKDIPWKIKQKIKERIGYGERWGFEAFPPDDQVVDAANLYWVFMPKEGATIEDLNFNRYRLYPRLYGG